MLRYRLMSGTLIVLALLLALYRLPAVGMWGLALAVSTLGMLEFYALMREGAVPVFRVVGVLAGLALVSGGMWTRGMGCGGTAAAPEVETAILAMALLVVFVRQFPQKNNAQPLATVACTLLGILYVPFLLNYFVRLAFLAGPVASPLSVLDDTGRLWLLYLVVVVKASDTGAYACGRLFGRHKLFPRLSPKKTWEGLAGGIAAAIGSSVLFQVLVGGRLGVVPLPLTHALTLGLLLAVVGVAGDLFESLLKRATGAKDSSTMIPGMGGVLDVLDSLLFSAPVLYVYVKVCLL